MKFLKIALLIICAGVFSNFGYPNLNSFMKKQAPKYGDGHAQYMGFSRYPLTRESFIVIFNFEGWDATNAVRIYLGYVTRNPEFKADDHPDNQWKIQDTIIISDSRKWGHLNDKSFKKINDHQFSFQFDHYTRQASGPDTHKIKTNVFKIEKGKIALVK